MQAAFTVGWSLAGEVEDDFKSFLYTEDLPELGFASHANNIQWETFCVITVVWLSALTDTCIGQCCHNLV